MRKVLVLDANQRSALAVIRSLGRRGLSLVAGDCTPDTIGGASRYAAISVLYPDPAKYPGAFAEEVAAIVRRFDIDTVVPVTDLTTMLLASQSRSSQNVRLTCSPLLSYEALTDKASLLRLADRLGVAAPETRVAWTTAEIEAAAQHLGQPIVLKPARSRYLKNDRVVATSVEVVPSVAQLSAAIARLEWLGDIPCLVQRFIPGHGAGVFTLYGPTGPIAWFCHKRIREKPPGGGVSVLSESVRIDPAMQAAAGKLLSAVGWTGVAMVEFRVSEDGMPYLMEVNGRLWGSLQLAIDCGIDFPWLLYQGIHGLPVDASGPYTLGRRLRWLLGDLDTLIIQLRSAGSPGRGKGSAIGDFLHSFLDMSCRQETFRMSDPGPGVREALLWLQALRR